MKKFHRVGIILILVLVLLGGCHRQTSEPVDVLPANYEVFVMDDEWNFISRYKVNAYKDFTETSVRILLLSDNWVTTYGSHIEIVPIKN